MHAFLVLALVTLTPNTIVSVSGVAEHVQSASGRHAYVMYDLCDASAHCVRVVRFGVSSVTADQMQTATGKFRRLVFVNGHHVLNAIVIGHP